MARKKKGAPAAPPQADPWQENMEGLLGGGGPGPPGSGPPGPGPMGPPPGPPPGPAGPDVQMQLDDLRSTISMAGVPDEQLGPVMDLIGQLESSLEGLGLTEPQGEAPPEEDIDLASLFAAPGDGTVGTSLPV